MSEISDDGKKKEAFALSEGFLEKSQNLQ